MDIVQREGRYPLPPQASKTILGVEFSGTVTKVGDKATKYKVGDAVFGLTYGVSTLGPLELTTRAPTPSTSVPTSACVSPSLTTSLGFRLRLSPRTGSPVSNGRGGLVLTSTAYQAVFLEGNMKKGANVLVHAGASGVGVAAIQLARESQCTAA